MQNQNELLHTLTVDVLPTLTPEAAGLLVLREMGRHPDRVCPHFDLIFFRSGTLDMQEEGRQFRVQAGQVLLLWPNRGHGRIAAYPAGLSFYWIHFRMEPTEGARDASEVLPVPPWATPARPDHLTALFRRYLDDQEEGALDSVSAGLIILLMLREMFRPPLPGAGVERSSVIPARRAQAYICKTPFHEKISVAVLACELRSNANYLSRVYRQVYRRTATHAIHRERLEYARNSLLDTLSNIDEIARASGFDDPSYFRRLFKRRLGMTLFAYRRLAARVYVNTE